MRTMRTMGVTAAVAAALVIPAVAASPAFAQNAGSQGGGGRPGVQASGTCTAAGTWKLSAKPDDGRLEVEFEVDTNVAGQAFSVTITDGTAVVFTGTRTTAGRSGSFSVSRLTANQPGKDTVKAVATRAGNTCSGKVKI